MFLPSNRSLARWSVAVLFLAVIIICMPANSAITAQTATPFADDSPPAPISEARLRQWIEQLASDDYAVRERAAESLVRAGTVAESVLHEAAKSAELETQMQAERILAIILESAIENQIKAFEADVDGSRGISLAGWKHARKRLGDDANARKVFVQLYRAESRLFATYDRDREKIGVAFAERVNRLQKTLLNRGGVRIVYYYQNTAATLRDNIRALLLIGSDTKMVVDTSAIQPFDQLLQQVLPANQMGNQTEALLIREWLGEWIEHRSADASLEYRHIMMGMMYGAEKALHIAERMLRRENTDSGRKMWAALCAAKFGDARHVELIEPLLEDEDTVHSSSSLINRKRIIRQTQLRDIALAVLIRLTKQNYADYGLHHIVENPPYVFQMQTIYFDQPADREQALKKWREWRASHPPVAGKDDGKGE